MVGGDSIAVTSTAGWAAEAALLLHDDVADAVGVGDVDVDAVVVAVASMLASGDRVGDAMVLTQPAVNGCVECTQDTAATQRRYSRGNQAGRPWAISPLTHGRSAAEALAAQRTTSFRDCEKRPPFAAIKAGK
jgi:hypothetical protein